MQSDKLSDRLKDMLLETGNKNDGQHSSSAAARPLIQVVDTVVNNDDDVSSDDDCPPPISFPIIKTGSSSAANDTQQQSMQKSTDTTTTIPSRAIISRSKYCKAATAKRTNEEGATARKEVYVWYEEGIFE